MLAMMKWIAGIGVEICIVYILMYLLGFVFVLEVFILLFVSLFILSIIFLFISPKSEKEKSVKLIAHLFASCFIFFSFIFITIRYYPLLGSDFAEGLTKEKILSLKPGMSKNDIVAIIGNPIKIIKNNNKYKFVYATPGIYREGFEFQLGLINNKLDYLYIQRNDFGVYHCNKKGCSNIFMPEALEELISYSSKKL